MRDSDRQSPPPRSAHPHQRAPAQAGDFDPSDEAQRHLHRIAVETGPEPVFVTIGRPPEAARRPANEPAEPFSAPAAGGSGHAPIPGGFAKLFNRVIDSGAWAGLPEAARAVYVPMVRFAEGREGFRVRIGLAALMRYTRLSRSSVKRALRALLEARLIAIVRAGGVAPDGTNRTNIYQLLLPEHEAADCSPLYGGTRAAPPASPGAGLQSGRNGARRPARDARGNAGGLARVPQSAARAKRGAAGAQGQAHVADGSTAGEGKEAEQNHPWFAPERATLGLQCPVAFTLSSWAADPVDPFAAVARHADLPGGSPPDPLPDRMRSPAPGIARPPAGLSPVPAGGCGTDPVGGPLLTGTGTLAEPLHRATKSYDISDEVGDDDFEVEEMMPETESALSGEQHQLRAALEAWGVDSQVACDVVRDYDRRQIARAISLARQAKARGGLINPAGYIVRCLDGVAGVRDPAVRMGGGFDLPSAGQSERRVEEGRALAARASADARLDELDDQTLAHLSARVLAMHADRPAMVRLLSARPPRESRLMRAEIAALLEV